LYGGGVLPTDNPLHHDQPEDHPTRPANVTVPSYMLYNDSADQCLTVNVNVLSMADCGSSGQSWRTGTRSTVVNLYSSLCLDESSGWPVLASCEPSKSTQHWAKE
ncbi:ricin-type beta-trefoil lectin domain protein, partial [Streptomyces sp. NPDC098085]|uniref:ricin-type beta-trefoil lectin domain protein n=1 Tax=Streptomyces sp. NPDC098085 TaxID=3366094 RepID=UPI00380D2BD0